jgi:glycosyltransferase involved in cell wall biosynthesis
MGNRSINAQDSIPDGDDASLSSKKRERDTGRTGPARIALAHDWLVTVRGGEAVLERIAGYITAEHQASVLLTLFDAGVAIGPATDKFARVAAGKSRLPMAKSFRRWMAPLYPSMVEELGERLESLHDANPIDLLISTSSGLIKNLKAPGRASHLCYCHTPARWLYSQRGEYGKGSGGGGLRGLGLKIYGDKLRAFDRSGTRFVSRFIANSEHTRLLIENTYSREATVVPPPVRTKFFRPDPAVQREDFWLLVSALEPYKRVDLAIEAAAMARQRLIVAGEGTQKGFLMAHARAMSKKHAGGVKGLVEFVGRVSDDQLLSLYRRAGVFLFPQVEDFGITAVEAQACGCPVVARAEGGALDTVIDGQTGVFFEEADAAAIVAAIKTMPSNPAACRTSAKRFSETLFDQRMAMQIESAL